VFSFARMNVTIPKETQASEKRVAISPDNVAAFAKLGYDVRVEAGAGESANFPDSTYESAGATIVGDSTEIWGQADLLLKLNPPTMEEVSMIREGATLISFAYPARNEDLLKALGERKVNFLGMDCVPRISRAQSMDALSSMANVAGYRAVVEASHRFGRFFAGQITAAGKVPPAKILIIGAGVAGLAAIGAARNMGAIVRAFDTRPAVKEEVKSLGGEFLELDFEEDGAGSGGYAKVMSKEFIEAEMKLFAEQAEEVDIIITTAMIPGKKSPVLITEDMVKSMKRGSVIVDLAAEGGGNCELTEPGEAKVVHGVNILGYTDLPSRLPTQSSRLYGNNLVKLVQLLGTADEFLINQEDEVVRGALVLDEGKLSWPPPKVEVSQQPPKPKAEPEGISDSKGSSIFSPGLMLGILVIILLALGWKGENEFLDQLTVFVLACFVGYMVVWNVTPALHTPLMSVTNAISGIIVIGGMLFVTGAEPWTDTKSILAGVAIFLATINVVGGFLVTQRMLKMFRKE
jgi:NAD(P) transhydrogenase subunit alpha